MTAFEREIRAFLCVVGITKYDVFAPHYPRFFTEFERYTVSKSTMNNLYNEKYKELRQGMAIKLAKRLQYFLDGDPTFKTPADLAERLGTCGGGTVSFLLFEKGKFCVSVAALIALYGRPGVEQPVSSDLESQGDSDRTILAITLPTPLEAITSEQQDRLIDRLLAVITAALPRGLIERLAERLAESVGYVLVKAVTEGCTTIKIEVSRTEADQILRAFREGQLADAGVIAVDQQRGPVRLPAPGTLIDPLSSDAHRQFTAAWKAAARRDGMIRPWRRLRWLFSSAVRLSPLAQVIGDSDERSYAAPRLLQERWRSLLVDLSMTGILWPLLTAALLVLTLSALRLHYPFLAMDAGVATGVALSLAGAQVCASVVSPIAVGAGALVMGWGFGLAHAFVIGKFGASGAFSPFNATAIHRDLFMAVAGGPVGLSAPEWPETFSVFVIVPLLAAIAISIGTAGWLMAQPRMAAGDDAPVRHTAEGRGFGRWFRNQRTLAGIVVGILAGSCIGLVYGLTQLFSLAAERFGAPPAGSFMVAFALMGGAVFGTTTWVRTDSSPKAWTFGVLHASVALGLCLLLLRLPEGIRMLISLSAASAYFHATWFTAAFIFAARFASVRSAVVATTIEGAVGFTAFVIFRMLHG
jgi:hypothetical protein